MPKIATSPNDRIFGIATRSADGSRETNFPRPVTDLKIGKIAAQLVAGYGRDAVPLAMRMASHQFQKGDAANFATWCLIVIALEQLDRQEAQRPDS
jgi:hypothetical protein